MTPDPADTTITSRRRLLKLGAAGAGAAVALPAVPAAAASFRDVTSRTKFAREIRWMAEKGYAKGWPDGTYRPLANVARDAFAAFLYRLQGSPGSRRRPRLRSPTSPPRTSSTGRSPGRRRRDM